MVLLAFLIADPMERSRNSKLSRRDQLDGWSTDVGDIASPGTEEVLRALLLHPPALRGLRGVLGTPRRRLRLQHLGRRRLPLHARPLPEVLAIQGQGRHRFCGLPTMRNGGASLLKATKYVKIIFCIMFTSVWLLSLQTHREYTIVCRFLQVFGTMLSVSSLFKCVSCRSCSGTRSVCPPAPWMGGTTCRSS